MRSNLSSLKTSTAIAPSPAIRTLCPAFSKIFRATTWLTGVSSASNTRKGRTVALAAVLTGGAMGLGADVSSKIESSFACRRERMTGLRTYEAWPRVWQRADSD